MAKLDMMAFYEIKNIFSTKKHKIHLMNIFLSTGFEHTIHEKWSSIRDSTGIIKYHIYRNSNIYYHTFPFI